MSEAVLALHAGLEELFPCRVEAPLQLGQEGQGLAREDLLLTPLDRAADIDSVHSEHGTPS